MHLNIFSSGIYAFSINCLQIRRRFGQKNRYVRLVKDMRVAQLWSVRSLSQQPLGQFWGVPQGSILIPPVF